MDMDNADVASYTIFVFRSPHFACVAFSPFRSGTLGPGHTCSAVTTILSRFSSVAVRFPQMLAKTSTAKKYPYRLREQLMLEFWRWLRDSFARMLRRGGAQVGLDYYNTRHCIISGLVIDLVACMRLQCLRLCACVWAGVRWVLFWVRSTCPRKWHDAGGVRCLVTSNAGHWTRLWRWTRSFLSEVVRTY